MIHRAGIEDAEALAGLAIQMWTDHVSEDLTESSPVGYLEGIFVSEGFRKQGIAAELLTECEKWAKEKICRSVLWRAAICIL